jgi:hypothetical protein
MLSFVSYDSQGPREAWPLRHAHLLGKENLAIASRFRFDGPRLVCEKPTIDEAALALQHDGGPSGVLTLQTCLLPDRERPYLLELELARHRIMLFLNKLEEWSLADLGPDDPVMRRFEEARGHFTEALSTPAGPGGAYTPGQATSAQRSLEAAIVASEMLVRRQAGRQLATRLNADPAVAKPVPRPRLGVAVHNEQFGDPLKKVLSSHFDVVNVPLLWAEIEREEGRYSFVKTDRWIEWAVRVAKMPLIGGPVIDFARDAYPAWLGVWEHDYSSLREFAYEHAKRVVTRYRRTITRWIAISGANLNDGFSFSVDEMLELTRLSVLLIRKLHPSAKVVVEVAQPFGEHVSTNGQSISPLLYAELVMESGIDIDALGLRIQMGDLAPGRSTRDLMELSAVLDAFSVFDRPLDITALGAPSVPPALITEEDLARSPGHWQRDWNADQQGDWLDEALCVCASKPFVRSVIWQALYDTVETPTMPNGGLISREGKAKPALRRLYDLRQCILNRKPPARAMAGAPGAGPAA